MILKLHGHLGDTVSALVDGQLGAEEEERAWAHVLGCPGCRGLVAREGWIKQRVGGITGEAPHVSRRLVDSLAGLPAEDSWDQVHLLEERSRRRRTTAVLAGAGSLGAAALALVAMTGTPAGSGRVPVERGPASVNPPAFTPAPALRRTVLDVVDAALAGTATSGRVRGRGAR